MKKNKQLFISKSITELDSLVLFCQHQNISLLAHSFLQFEALPFRVQYPFQAIFFGSPRAVDFFFKQEAISDECFIGCIGEVTAQSIINRGYQPKFIGKNSGNPSEVGLEFKSLVGVKRVLFPQSITSNRSISSQFPENQIEEISIYKTQNNSISIPECAVYVFTSPSNVDGFLVENNIPSTAQIIAWGKTTEKHLISKGFQVNITLKEASIEELISIMFSI
jgi:uroporphyrinogen-III synthase